MVDFVYVFGNPFSCHIACDAMQLYEAMLKFAVVIAIACVKAYATERGQIQFLVCIIPCLELFSDEDSNAWYCNGVVLTEEIFYMSA